MDKSKFFAKEVGLACLRAQVIIVALVALPLACVMLIYLYNLYY